MTKETIRAAITEIGIIPAVRLSSADDARFAAEAIYSSGIPIVEVTMTVPGAVAVISQLTKQNSALIVGAGTVLDVETAQRCLDAGVAFLTTPGLDLEIVNFAVKHGTVVFPGAMTPGEVMAASRAGADFVKIFPCAQLGGPSYIRALKAPFPKIPLIASGGVNQETATDFIRAGAVALGIGRDLIHPDAIRRREDGWIRELSRRYLSMVKQARNPT
ncbi:MAG: bifunctional 4-hydroxy-2-oxoglutarate aldolase/2-dehydro-3-deoxy-phosphogluconate aldolase [Bryobacteraceae bacterium]|jgi:2-dehydro-3-deoxyphosphogluconate aldolase/(4S)-4-hydroxy-2-oxoglutarate aldolase